MLIISRFEISIPINSLFNLELITLTKLHKHSLGDVTQINIVLVSNVKPNSAKHGILVHIGVTGSGEI